MRFQRKYANSEVFDPTKEKQKEMDFDVSGFIFCFMQIMI